MDAPTISLRSAEEALILFPFKQSFLDAFKLAVPPGARWYEPEARAWRFNAVFLQEVYKLCITYYNQVTLTGEAEALLAWYDAEFPPVVDDKGGW